MLKIKNGPPRALLMTFVCSLLVLLFISGFTLFSSRTIRPEQGILVNIGWGMNPAQIAQLLCDSQVIPDKTSFLLSVKMMGVGPKLQAGSYLFKGRLSLYSILKKISSGDVINRQITMPEGMRSREIASHFRQIMNIDSAAFMALIVNPEYTRSLGIDSDRLEGYLFPNTYRFHVNSTPEDVIERMVDEFRHEFTDSLVQLARNRGFTIHDVMTLASIIEGEAFEDSERPVIAAVYLNRLRKGMALQACPTVQYLLPEGPRRLLKKDLEIESPYNTYLHPGLPPGPVNNPGMASILAVLHPADVDYLYLVANGDGTHTFSKTNTDHIEAKIRFHNHRRVDHDL